MDTTNGVDKMAWADHFQEKAHDIGLFVWPVGGSRKHPPAGNDLLQFVGTSHTTRAQRDTIDEDSRNDGVADQGLQPHGL